MPFEAVLEYRPQGASTYRQQVSPILLTTQETLLHAGESTLAIEVGVNLEEITVRLDQSEGDFRVAPLGEDGKEVMNNRGLVGLIFSAEKVPEGRAVAILYGRDALGAQLKTSIKGRRLIPIIP